MYFVLEEIVNAVENLDFVKLQCLLAYEPVLMQDLEHVFNILKSEGHSHLKAFIGNCSCCIDKNTTIEFHTSNNLATPGVVYLKQFGLVFLQDNNTGEYKYFKLCAHIDWRQK